MKLGHVGLEFGIAALIALATGCSSEDALGSKDGTQNGTGGSAGGGDDAGLLCSEPSPVGCAVAGCPSGYKCDTASGCAPSACGCDSATGDWICTADCGGGTCVADTAGVKCTDPSPAGCATSGCPSGQTCDTNAGCAPSACSCDAVTGTWICTSDCSGGTCVPEAADAGVISCPGDNPEGCSSKGCPQGQTCDTTQGCAPTGCACDPSTGTWLCTADCSGGICVQN
jgi:hypothetical protein